MAPLPSIKAKPVYTTPKGAAFCGDALDLLRSLPEGLVNLVMTSPPFALLREKSYGNETQKEYVDWLLRFCEQVRRVLADDGSFVLDLGGAYQRGVPSRSLHQWRVMIRCVDELGFHLAEEVYWHNPSKLPSPIEWVNKRKLRMKRLRQYGVVVWQDGVAQGRCQQGAGSLQRPHENAAERPGRILQTESETVWP